MYPQLYPQLQFGSAPPLISAPSKITTNSQIAASVPAPTPGLLPVYDPAKPSNTAIPAPIVAAANIMASSAPSSRPESFLRASTGGSALGGVSLAGSFPAPGFSK